MRQSPAIGSTAVASDSQFAALGLRPELLRALAEAGYDTPTPIQSKGIPAVLAGRDVLGAAQTGTGKTAAFTLPMLQALAALPPEKPRTVRALVMTPTRELCVQVEESIRTYGKYLGIRSAAIYGGVGMGGQFDALRRGPRIVVATPGRLLDHLSQRSIDLSAVSFLVLDEADRMLDMGFIHDIKRILALLPRARQTLLFSATFSPEIRTLSSSFLRDPVSIEVAPRNATASMVTQSAHRVDKDSKRQALAHLIRSRGWNQVLVFCKTKHGANRLAELLEKDGITADAIHGNKSQNQRQRALNRFKDGEVTALVATDVAARGIDIAQLPIVVNYDLPNVPEDYVHRIGRTARAGASGEAVSLVSNEDRSLLTAIENLLKRAIPVRPIEGFVAVRDTADPRPVDVRGGPGRSGDSRGAGARGAGARGAGARGEATRFSGQRAEGARTNGPRRDDARPARTAGVPGTGQRPANSPRPANPQRATAPRSAGYRSSPVPALLRTRAEPELHSNSNEPSL